MSAAVEAAALADLMVCALADCLTSEEVATNGAASFLPVTAIGLARRTHAPGLTHLGGAVGVDSRWERVAGSTVGPAYWDGAAALLNHPDEFWPFVGAGRITTIFHRAAQIDARGNLGNSEIRGPRPVRLPGGAAMGDTAALIPRVLLWSTTHDPRTFVRRVDFRTCPGYLDEPGQREALGMPGGPDRVVTDLATMDFTPEGQMRLRSLHPGVELETVQERTGFELALPDGEVPATREPTAEERTLIAALDPDGYRLTEFRSRAK
jgi:glutaconate CoA-transferase, subunit B